MHLSDFVHLIISSILIQQLLPVDCISHEPHTNFRDSYKNMKIHSLKYNPNISDIRLHGILLWFSMGFLMPVGILLIRMCNKKQESRGKARVLYYLHVILQVSSVVLITTSAVLSIQKFENSFHNTHQRLGLVLYAAVWIQALVGFCRPNRGRKGRSKWYLAHWLSGTAMSFAGIGNIYTGLGSYRRRTKKSTSLWFVLFTAEVSILALLYLFQDKWEYIIRSGKASSSDVGAADQMVVDSSNSKSKTSLKLLMEPCKKSNALINHFKQTSG